MAIGTYLQKLLSVWSIPSMMLLSLSVQVVLNFASPFRRTSRSWAPAIVWSAYLLSDSVAIYTTGLISNTVRTSSAAPLLINQDLLALWASILLVHMGGPNAITAYSLEDNSLWLRHVVRLLSQLAVICYILLKTSVENNILVPTLLMLLLGMVRYSERIRALFLACQENMKVSVCGKRLIEQLPEEDISVSYYFYERFRGMIVDIMPNPSELEQSRQFFMETSPEKALKVISRELHMMYEVLYTKIVVRNSSLGLFITVMYTYLVVAATVFFYLSGRNRLDGVDGKITGYMVSGIGLITYDWVFMSGFSAMAWVPELKGFLYLLFKWLGLKFESCLILNRAWPRILGICQLDRAWSRRLGAFNLLDCSIKHHLKRNKRKNKAIRCCGDLLDKAIKWCGLNNWFDKMTHTTTEHLPDELWHFIFASLQQKASDIHNEEQAREVYDSKGEAVLQEMNLDVLEKSYMKDFDYGKALLCWHIATEICYNVVNEDENDENRKWSKILSDYLTYLLIHQPKLTAAVAGITHERYDQTCLEVKESARKLGVENLKDLCAKALEVRDEENGEGGYTGEHAEERSRDAGTGGRVLHGRSVFHDACNLARKLRNYDNKWEITVRVWEEMLSYAAGHCRGNEHARTVSRGGEILTHVWLLMAHFGITAQWPKN